MTTIKILDTTNQIREKVGIAVQKKIIRRIAETLRLSKNQVNSLIIKKIEESSTYESLISGELRGEFGLDEASVNKFKTNLDKLFSITITKQSFIESKLGGKAGLTVSGGMFIQIDPELDANRFQFSTDFFSYKTEKGEIVPWLDYLLFGGTSELIADYRYKEKTGQGRSGLGIMLKASAGGFSVSSEFSGTKDDNFLTRVIKENEEEIKAVLHTTFRNFKK